MCIHLALYTVQPYSENTFNWMFFRWHSLILKEYDKMIEMTIDGRTQTVTSDTPEELLSHNQDIATVYFGGMENTHHVTGMIICFDNRILSL